MIGVDGTTTLRFDAGRTSRLDVARATIVEAYEQLLGEGYLETRSGSGTRVAAELPETLLTAAPKERAREPARTAGRREPARPFRSGLVDWENFPHDDWGRLLGRFWRNPPIALLEHNDAFGWLPLREAIAAALSLSRSMAISCSRSDGHGARSTSAGLAGASDVFVGLIRACGDVDAFDQRVGAGPDAAIRHQNHPHPVPGGDPLCLVLDGAGVGVDPDHHQPCSA